MYSMLVIFKKRGRGHATLKRIREEQRTRKCAGCCESTYLTTFGWLSSLRRDISLIAVLGTPSVSLQKRRVIQYVEKLQIVDAYSMEHTLVFPLLSFRVVSCENLISSVET